MTTRRLKGIRPVTTKAGNPGGYRVYVTVGARFRERTFPPGTPVPVMQQWREATRLSMRDGNYYPRRRGQPHPTVQVLYDLLDPSMTADEEAAIWTLIRYLKKREAHRFTVSASLPAGESAGRRAPRDTARRPADSSAAACQSTAAGESGTSRS
jgi:hypothetical protein